MHPPVHDSMNISLVFPWAKRENKKERIQYKHEK